MKGIKRVVIVLSAIIGSMLGLAGCGYNSGPTFEERTQAMLVYMQEKYGVEFQVDWSSRSVTRDYHSWNCSLKGNTDENKKGEVEVYQWYMKEGEPYWDTYFSIMIRGEVEERVLSVLSDIAEPYKLAIVGSGFLDIKYDSIEQLDQYLEEEGNELTVYGVQIAVHDQGDAELNKALFRQLKECLKKANIGNPYFNLFFLSAEQYEGVDKSNISKLWPGSYVERIDGHIMESEEDAE